MQDFRQEIFTKVKNHLLKQNKKCVDDKGNCKLRFENEYCAAGCLIPDRDYSPDLENYKHWSFFHESGYSSTETDLIEILVSIHDGCEPIDWENRLSRVATLERLEF